MTQKIDNNNNQESSICGRKLVEVSTVLSIQKGLLAI